MLSYSPFLKSLFKYVVKDGKSARWRLPLLLLLLFFLVLANRGHPSSFGQGLTYSPVDIHDAAALLQGYFPQHTGSNSTNICDMMGNGVQLVNDYPSMQAIFNILGPWATSYPALPSNEPFQAGTISLAEDWRIKLFLAEVGDAIQNMSILELGPLEGGHSLMLARAGAKRILGVEGNPMAFLKCLAIKEMFHINNANYLLGNFVHFARVAANSGVKYDAVVAIGVLYHMTDPVRLLYDLSRITSKIVLWTHVYDTRVDMKEKYNWGEVTTATVEGFTHTLHCHNYFVKSATFLGGPDSNACWLEREDIIGAMEAFGFQQVSIMAQSLEHPNGPEITLYATK